MLPPSQIPSLVCNIMRIAFPILHCSPYIAQCGSSTYPLLFATSSINLFTEPLCRHIWPTEFAPPLFLRTNILPSILNCLKYLSICFLTGSTSVSTFIVSIAPRLEGLYCNFFISLTPLSRHQVVPDSHPYTDPYPPPPPNVNFH